LLSVASFDEGKYALAFPSFGSERMGAPVASFCRIDDRAIRLREPILEPDAVIIQDPTLLHSIDVFSGLNPEGYILINSTRSFEELGIAEFAKRFPPHHVCSVGATGLAMKHVGRPFPNAALLGGFAAITKLLVFDSVAQAIQQKFSGPIGEANVAAAREAYEIALTA
jgi:pyruvate ferredoxin oxidoreductase gamma subunit